LALDEQVLAARLSALEEYLRLLGDIARTDLASFLNDPRTYGSAERFLQLAIEAVFDVGTHLIAGLGLPRPSRYADILPTLADAGVIRRETAAELASTAGFRNVLVHDYTRIDRSRVHGFITSRLEAFRHFAFDVATFLGRTDQTGGSPSE
jgi:uncharacterized protein YutE (UPF0331/DUF86 family)